MYNLVKIPKIFATKNFWPLYPWYPWSKTKRSLLITKICTTEKKILFVVHPWCRLVTVLQMTRLKAHGQAKWSAPLL